MNIRVEEKKLNIKINQETKKIEVSIKDNSDKIDLNVTNYNDKEVRQLIEENSNDIQELQNNKVDKIEGKGLSTNDYTTLEKNKLAGLQNYDDTEVKRDIANLKTNKADRSEIPDVSQFVKKTATDLVNYYLKSETYTRQEVNNLIGSIQQFHYEIVQTLPSTGANNILYLVPSTNPKTQNIYDEYVYANNKWEQIGSTAIDLSGYVTESQMNTAFEQYGEMLLQAFYLKEQVDEMFTNLNIPSSLADLSSDTTHRTVTDTEKTNWNNKSNFSGNYNDLSDKPELFSGSYLDLTNIPLILRNDTGEINIYSLVPESGLVCYQFLNSVTLTAEMSSGTWRVTLAPGNNVSADSDGQFSFFCPAGNIYVYPVETPITSETLWAGGYCPTIEDVEIMTAEAGYWEINQNRTATGTVNMIKGHMFKKTRPTGVTRLTIKFPDEIDDNYKSRLVLHTATSFSTFTISADYDVYFYGDDCADGVLTGAGSKYYDINARADGFGGILVEVSAKEVA